MAALQRSTSVTSGGFWPHWKDNKLFSLLLAILLVYIIVWLSQKIENEGFSEQMAPSLSVTATGDAVLETNLATVDLGVTTNDVTANKSQDANTEKSNSLIAKLKEMGIDDRDIKTSNYSIYPQYDYTLSPPVVVGFETNQTVTVRIRNKDLVGPILSAAGDLGATNVGNVRYEADDTTNAEAVARAEAIENAHEQAEQIAKSLGVSLGDIVSYSESFGSPVFYSYRGEALGGDGGVNIPEGESEVNVTVYVNYAIR